MIVNSFILRRYLEQPWSVVYILHCFGATSPVSASDVEEELGDQMVEGYLPILVFLAVGIGLSIVLLGLGFLMGPRHADAEKDSPFECGFDAFEDARIKFDVRYYLVAILFIIFDLEIAFLFPWAVVLDKIGSFGLISMGVFLLILIIGFIYEWKQGALEWE